MFWVAEGGDDVDRQSLTDLIKEIEFLHELVKVTKSTKKEKDTQILPRSADVSRRLGGLRMTSCKSAKDRTSMSITWEMSRILNQCHGLPSSEILHSADIMRQVCVCVCVYV